jgi:RNA polymerase sigma-70 factor (ECF subfamily)
MNSGRAVRQIDMGEELLVEAARAGDHGAFERLAGGYRRELQVHCYRMLGSVEDAEDAVQETYLRAWSRLASYAGRASFRAWMYGIATHTCLDALRRKKARAWPTDVTGPADANDFVLSETESPWLSPYPDRLLQAAGSAELEPEESVTAKETIELAFLAALQHLPARQRAVLILRDVVDWSAKDTAAALEMSQAAVNSALQRAHASLSEYLPAERGEWTARADAAERALVQRLIAAWESSDNAALVALLRADARLVMPPVTAWFAGREAIGMFFTRHVFSQMGDAWRLVPTAANRQPAFAVYYRRPGEAEHRKFAIGVLTVEDGAIVEMAIFQQPELFAPFALPAAL